MDLEGWILSGAGILIAILWGILTGIGQKAINIASQAVSEIAKISARMDVFETNHKHFNDSLETLIRKFDKVEEHGKDIAVLQDKVLAIPELDKRLREVEYVKRNSNS